MGRPLKIKHSSTSDIGFPLVSYLTAAVTPAGLSTSEFYGVIGGTNTLGTQTNPTVSVRVFINGAGYTEGDGYIIKQKGSKTYQVAQTTTIQDESMTVGQTYIILTVGTTDWVACGAPGTYAVGTIFTCTAAGAGSGTVLAVGNCALADLADASLTAGTMTVTINPGDSTAIRVSRFNNKYALDFSATPVRYMLNFFNGVVGETVIKSGTTGSTNVAGQQNNLTLAQPEKYNTF